MTSRAFPDFKALSQVSSPDNSFPALAQSPKKEYTLSCIIFPHLLFKHCIYCLIHSCFKCLIKLSPLPGLAEAIAAPAYIRASSGLFACEIDTYRTFFVPDYPDKLLFGLHLMASDAHAQGYPFLFQTRHSCSASLSCSGSTSSCPASM